MEADETALATYREATAIRFESEAEDLARFRYFARQLSRRRVPNPDRLVGTARSDELSVGAKSD